MARDAQCTQVLGELRSLFPKAWLEDAARSTGWLQRRRKVSPVAMFWTLVLGFGCGNQRSIASLRRQYEVETGERLVPSSFYDRFTPELVTFLRWAVAHGCAEMARRASRLQGTLTAVFEDIVAIDSSVLRLHPALAKTFPGTRTNHSPAAAKLHLVTSVLGRGPRSIKITDERTHDGRVRHLGAWVTDALLLFDLGYYNFRAFSSIRRNGGYFITRLKEGANPVLTAVLDGPFSPVVQPGARLRDVLAKTTLAVIDVQAELSFRRRRYRGVSHGAAEIFRIVAVRHPETGRFHVYVTNLPPEQLGAEEIAATYAGRWAIELIFKELKSTYRLHDLPSKKKHVVEALILTAVLTLIVSRALHDALARRLSQADARRLRPQRWSRVFLVHADRLLGLILAPRQFSRRWRARWWKLLRSQALDPNVGRHDLRELMLAVQMS